MTEVTPCVLLLLFSTTQVNTECDLLDSLFMRVSPVCLFSAPFRIRASTWSTAQQERRCAMHQGRSVMLGIVSLPSVTHHPIA